MQKGSGSQDKFWGIVCYQKSKIIMKSSLCSDEIFGVPPQMKLNPPSYPDEVGFHREAISSTRGGFLPPARTDLVKKSPVLANRTFFRLVLIKKMTQNQI